MQTAFQSTSELSLQELECQQVEALPDRAAMSLVNANLAVPVNLALAANVLSDGALAAAGAQQTTPIVQGI
jgi:glycine cleavage system regulatory protein